MQMLSAANYQLCHGREAASIRVVLLETNSDVKRRLQMIIEEDQTYAVVAWADSRSECESVLEQYVPELLVVGASQMPIGLSFDTSGFPLVIHLRAANNSDQSAVGGVYQDFRRELVRIRHEIYMRKASQLSMLLDHYFAGLNSFSYLAAIQVCQAGEIAEVSVDRIQVIEAAGNYVRIYSAEQVWTLRETISGLQSRLDPKMFVRVHRSYIVNLNHVSLFCSSEGSSLLARDSSRTIPIGPNYRGEIARIFGDRNTLVA